MKNLGFLAAATVLSILVACGDDDAAPGTMLPDGGTDAGGTVDSGGPAADGGVDAGDDDDDAVAPTGSFTVTPTASSSMPAGTFSPTKGSAQWRPTTLALGEPAGGILTVSLGDADRAIELSLYDDADTLGTDESFAADAEGSFAFRKARVETYREGVRWATDGDGSVVVKAFSSSSVTLELTNLAQKGAGLVGDVFTLAGTVTVPLTTLPNRTAAATSFAISNVLPEPISGEASNQTGAATPIASDAPTLGERAVPYFGTKRALEVSDTVGGTKRTLRLVFPSGHYPRAGQNLTLSKFDRITVAYFEGEAPTDATASTTKIWEADQGMAEVTARTDASISIKLTGARMQSESPAAKGLFTVDGQVTFPIP